MRSGRAEVVMTPDMVERLYAAFADVRRPGRIVGCPCCVGPDDDVPLLNRPLRDLTADDLSTYGAHALSTWGDAGDLHYFAPRLLELSAADAFVWPDIEIVFGKLAVAGWHEWPQRQVVADFLTEFWSQTLSRHPARPRIGTVLCALGCAMAELAGPLGDWADLLRELSEPAIRHLHELATEELAWPKGRPHLGNAFWDTTSAPYRQVMGWLTGGAAAAAVSIAFARTDSEELLELLAETEEAITR